MTENENDPIDALPDDVFDDLMHSLATSPSGSNRPGGNMAWVQGVRIDPEQLMRPRMACELLGIAKSTLYQAVEKGRRDKGSANQIGCVRKFCCGLVECGSQASFC